MKKTILIADDNRSITDILSAYARKEGYEPIVTSNGIDTLKKFEEESPTIVLLDVMMPGINGFEVCKQIRERSKTPVIMVTARGEDKDKIMGLEIGADDYVVKPFSPGEVMARIKAVLRRVEVNDDDKKVITINDFVLDIDSYSVTLGGNEINLTKKEIDILYLMASNIGKAFSRENLLDSIWSYDYFGETRTVDTHIKRIRAKLRLGDETPFDIKTIWGVGYKLEVKNE